MAVIREEWVCKEKGRGLQSAARDSAAPGLDSEKGQ